MHKFSLIISIFFSLTLFTLADNGIDYSDPDENAAAVIENYTTFFSQSDINNATYKVTKAITIINKQGDAYATFHHYGDKFRELKNFSGIIKDKSGKVIRKIGKKDLTVSSLSEHLTSDSYSAHYECKVPTYPYTVEYTYEEKWKNGIISYPPFIPQEGYMQAVKEASYIIEIPENMQIRYNKNFDCKIEETTKGDKKVYILSVQNIKALNWEPLAPPLRESLPRVLLAPSDFCFDSHCGSISDWSNYGKWMYKLLDKRDEIPVNILSKIKELTQDANSDKEKVKRIYNYLQNNSRYVSIQLGIGGFQPEIARSVLENGFGDCKGLSNAMKAMLNTIDIPSYYCEISTEEKDLYDNFANASQTNHVILLVPLKNDSVWLECTSQTIPFGYIHDNIAGHDALIITEDGGKLCRLPSYKDEQNLQLSKMIINISEDGTANGNISIKEQLHGYASNVQSMISNDRDKHIRYINGNISLPKTHIENVKTIEDKSAFPSCTLTADFTASDFTNKTGVRMFIPACPINKGSYNIFTSTSRTLDISIEYGFSELDSITFNIPENYTSESLPKDIILETPYGSFKTQTIAEGNKITYIQRIDILSGRYDKTEYDSIKKFFAAITSNIKRKIVLKKV